MSSVRITRAKLILIGLLFALLHLYTPSIVYQSNPQFESMNEAKSIASSQTIGSINGNVDESISTAKVFMIPKQFAIVPIAYASNTSPQITDLTKDQKIEKVQNFLVSKNAPLAAYSTQLVDDADKYGIDYRLVAAISIMESSGGLYDFRSYNAWGWGNFSFASYDQSVDAMSAYMKNDYYNFGLTNPSLIAPKYCPPNSFHWAANVTLFMEQMQ